MRPRDCICHVGQVCSVACVDQHHPGCPGALFQLGALALHVGVTRRQLTYWAQIGLVESVQREGRLLFEPEDVEWVRAIADLVRAGASVEALAEAARRGAMAAHLEALQDRAARALEAFDYTRASEAVGSAS